MANESQIIPFEKKEYLGEMRSKVTFSFEDAPVFDKFLQLLSEPSAELQVVLEQLMQQRSIDTAVGKQLDIIGDIVGQPRELLDSSFIPYFGYEGAFEAQSYGDLDDDSVGGFYWDINRSLTGNVLLTDEQYRLFIKAKILKNIVNPTPEQVIYFIRFVFGVERVQILVDQDAKAPFIMVDDDIGPFGFALLKYFVEDQYRSYFVPKTLGVNYGFGVAPAEAPFAFLGVAGAGGYGDYDPVEEKGINGGKWAYIL